MKILAISDEESKYLWEYFDKSKLEGIDLIISCGDLDPYYLSFLVTMTTVPVLYVHGNHAVLVLTIKFMCTMESVFWGLAGLCVTVKVRTSLPNGRCGSG